MDHIFIRGLRLTCTIGVVDRERTTQQPVQIDLDLELDLKEACLHDDLSLSVDYREVRDRLEMVVAASRFFLIEALAERLAGECLSIPRVKAVRLRVEKPGALRGTSTVGVEVFRSRG